jgi:hypothetical protein
MDELTEPPGKPIRQVGVEEVLDKLKRQSAAGCHVDCRLLQEARRPGQMYVVPLQNADEFLSLVWQSCSKTRPLVPVGQPRTLRHCASRLAHYEWRFENLVNAGCPWFRMCVDIDAGFDYSWFGWIALTPCNELEQQETPTGLNYTYDGVHKSIVLAKKLLNSELEYEPLEALLLTSRRS